MDKLKLYTLSQPYYQYISQFDAKVPHTSVGKESRPFIGIVLHFNDVSYFAPLTSPKQKHLTMKNAIDFHRIQEGQLGAINFNNMIPIPSDEAKEIDLNISIGMSTDELNYKNLLKNQKNWCDGNVDVLMNKAKHLRETIETTENEKLLRRCCDFKLLEEKCLEYSVKQKELPKRINPEPEQKPHKKKKVPTL